MTDHKRPKPVCSNTTLQNEMNPYIESVDGPHQLFQCISMYGLHQSWSDAFEQTCLSWRGDCQSLCE